MEPGPLFGHKLFRRFIKIFEHGGAEPSFHVQLRRRLISLQGLGMGAYPC